MEKIFWAKSTTNTSPNIIIIDDILEEFKGTEQHNEAMGLFIEARQWPCHEAIAPQKGQKSEACLHIAIHEGIGITIRSNFITTDSEGRHLPYMYFSRCSSIETAIEDVKKYANLVHKELNIEELHSAKQDIQNYKPSLEKKVTPFKKTSINGGYSKIWYHIQRH